MNAKERLRLEVLVRVGDGTMSLSQAAVRLGISYRQMRRVRERHRVEGDAGLVHRLRGVASNRRTSAVVRERVVALSREKYVGFGPTLLGEYLLKEEAIAFSHDTLRRWLSAEGLMPKVRRGHKHRRRRERRSRCGELVQMDGSIHDWLEGRGPWCCLMVMIDDASGRVLARFYEKETLASATDVFTRYAMEHGLPRALYVDRAGIYRSDKEPTGGQILAGEKPVTQFGRAMKNLKVELILAHSPQAKGRVERVNGTLQDRLVKALRLAGVSDIESANRLLSESFLEAFNERFVVPTRSPIDAHRVVSGEVLDREMCEHHERKVGRDWCVQWRGGLLQIDKRHARLGLAGKSVIVLEDRHGELELIGRSRMLTWTRVTSRPKRAKVKVTVVNNLAWKPKPNHPWRTPLSVVGPSSPTALPPRQREREQRTVLLR